jgi:hypothetical protein
MIINKCESGIFNVFDDAKHLFVDLAKITLRIFVLLLQQDKEDKKKRKE